MEENSSLEPLSGKFPNAVRKGGLYIPPELIREIADNLVGHRSALYTLSLTSKLWNQECQHLLYHTVIHRPWDVGRHSAPLRVFMDNPHLTGYIHTYRVERGGVFDPPNGQLWDLLRPGPALRAMKNLKHLHVEVDHNTVPDDILDGGPFQLLSFSWSGFLSRKAEARFLSFLTTQWDLRRLRSRIRWNEINKLPLDLSSCAKIQHLEGDRDLIELFLPDRNVSNLVWVPKRDDLITPVQHLSRELGLVEMLSLQTDYGFASISVFVDLIQHLQNLQYLELLSSGVEHLASVHKLPHLRGLILCGKFQYLNSNADERDKIFARFSLLEFLDIEFEAATLVRKFLRYSRGGDVIEYHRSRRQRFFNSFS